MEKAPSLRNSRLLTEEEIRNSPSRVDGISAVQEKEYRRTTCLFIRTSGKALDLHPEAVATASVFFHRFFMQHSFLDHERMFVASACLFLAAKVEESPKRVDVVMNKCYTVWHGREPPQQHEKAFKRLREKILIAERCVLHTLGFQLTVRHPYSSVMELLKKLYGQGRGADGGNGSNKALNRQLNQTTMSFVNDSLLTTLCLQYEPRQIAAAVVFLSYSFMGLPPVETVLLDADETMVSDICERILSLYGEHDGDPSVKIVESSTAVAASTPATASVSPPTPPSPSLKPNADSATTASSALHRANGGGPESVKIDGEVRRGSSNGSCRGVAVRSTDKGTQFRDPRSSTSTSQRKSFDEMKREGEEVYLGESEGWSARDSKRRKL